MEIVGGGLAGLGLGVALARAGVPTTVVEAGDYPRHRVCGEFIAGLDEAVEARLGLAPLLVDAKRQQSVEWFQRGTPAGRQWLARPALGISRHTLDRRLAETFVAAGGILYVNTRGEPAGLRDGQVIATGRRPIKSSWVGVKMHVRGLRLSSDLELHLAPACYVGLCEVEDGAVNVCGLFHRRHVAGKPVADLLETVLARAGLESLAARVREAEACSETLVTVAGLNFEAREPDDGRLRLGDAARAIAPFSGHGMALAFHAAGEAAGPLLAWSEKRLNWTDTVAAVSDRIRAKTRRRFRASRWLHPWILERRRQTFVARFQRLGWLPLRLFTRLLHT